MGAFVLYLASYWALRSSYEIVHRTNRGETIGHTVAAQQDPWDDVTVGMLKGRDETGWLRIFVAPAWLHSQRCHFYNLIFWPLRKTEEFYWNRIVRDK